MDSASVEHQAFPFGLECKLMIRGEVGKRKVVEGAISSSNSEEAFPFFVVVEGEGHTSWNLWEAVYNGLCYTFMPSTN